MDNNRYSEVDELIVFDEYKGVFILSGVRGEFLAQTETLDDAKFLRDHHLISIAETTHE